jgi:hypothetical protein
MNLLKIPNSLPIGTDFNNFFIKTKVSNGKYNFTVKNMEIFKEKMQGFVSYFGGAPPYVFPEMKIKYIKCEMSDFQYGIYKKIMDNENTNSKILKFKTKEEILKKITMEDLPNNFFTGTRIASNIVFPNKKIGSRGLESLTKHHILFHLHKYSVKFDLIINKIKKCTGKIFIYSNFKEYGGLKSLEKILDTYGYKNYINNGTGKKRYAILSGDVNDKMRNDIKNIYNRIDNINGKKIKIILGTPSVKEGISFFNVRQVHILEPYWNLSRMNQIMGRVNRFCSHKDLPEEQRKVKVYIYVVSHRMIETIDEYIHYLATQKNKIIRGFETALKESSIDCFLNENYLKYEKDDIICYK